MKISNLASVLVVTALSIPAGTIGAAAQGSGATIDLQREQAREMLAHRIVGTWILDSALTRELGPSPSALFESKLSFEPNPLAVELVRTANERTAALDVFGGGILRFDGGERLYVLVDERDGFRMLLFDHPNDPMYASPASYALGIEGEDVVREHVFFGTGRRAESAYARAEFFAHE